MSINDLPESVCWKVARTLDAPNQPTNWREFIKRINKPKVIYDSHRVAKFYLEILQPRGSPTLKLLEDLGKKRTSIEQLIAWLKQMRGCEELVSVINKPLEELAPKIERQPPSITVCVNGRFTLDVEAVGFAPLRYQWFKNDASLEGETRNQLFNGDVQYDDAGNYSCRVHNEFGTVFAQWIRVAVVPGVLEEDTFRSTLTPDNVEFSLPVVNRFSPRFLKHPESTKFVEGSRIRLFGDAVGDPAPQFQWYCDEQQLFNECSRELVIEDATAQHEGLYFLEATNKHACVKSLVANVRFEKRGEDETINKFEVLKFDAVDSVDSSIAPTEPDDDVPDFSHKGKSVGARGLMDDAEYNLTNRSQTNAMPSQKVALLIGNERYEHAEALGRLVHPVNDTHDLSAALCSIGFNVVSLINLTLQEMNDAVQFFYELLDERTYAIFYFAGHGFEINGCNYLMPVDATDAYSADENLSLSTLYAAMTGKLAKLSVLLLDCCRVEPSVDPLPSWLNSMKQHLQIPIQRKNVAVGFGCCARGRVLESPAMKNGFFAAKLLECITSPLKIDDVLFEVSKRIYDARILDPITGRSQVVYRHSTVVEDLRLTDPSANAEVDTYHARLWKAAHTAPESPVCILQNECVKISLCFTAEFSNALLIHSHVIKLKHCGGECTVNFVLPDVIGGAKVEICRPGEKQVDIREEFVRISDLQRIQGVIDIHVEVSYEEEEHLKQQYAFYSIKDPPLFAKINTLRVQ